MVCSPPRHSPPLQCPFRSLTEERHHCNALPLSDTHTHTAAAAVLLSCIGWLGSQSQASIMRCSAERDHAHDRRRRAAVQEEADGLQGPHALLRSLRRGAAGFSVIRRHLLLVVVVVVREEVVAVERRCRHGVFARRSGRAT